MTSVQRNLHGLLGEGLSGLTEEMHLDLIVENYRGEGVDSVLMKGSCALQTLFPTLAPLKASSPPEKALM